MKIYLSYKIVILTHIDHFLYVLYAYVIVYFVYITFILYVYFVPRLLKIYIKIFIHSIEIF